MIAVIDYGAGNLQSVEKALQFIGADVQITRDPEVLKESRAAILPGVGAFGDAMAALSRSGMVQPVQDFAHSGKPFMGICLGMQMLFEESEESPRVKGLGIFRGKILRIPEREGLKVPHMGWNSLSLLQRNGLFSGLPENPYVYFVHSYYLKAEDRSIVSSKSLYGVEIDASVQRGSVMGAQFHPEKSGKIGLQMLRNFVALSEGEKKSCMPNGSFPVWM